MVRFLLKMTNINPSPDQTDKEDEKIIDIFKQKIKDTYQNWWRDKLTSDENRKLIFFYQYKKNFRFEQYLDNLPRHIRMYTSRLRTSSHNYPIEVLRYCKPKVEAPERKCQICNRNETGDEHHYLLNDPK